MNNILLVREWFSRRVIVLTSLVVFSLASWFLYQSHIREKRLLAHVHELELRLARLEEKLEASDNAVKALQEGSVSGVLRRANTALLEALQDFLDREDKSLDESQEKFDSEDNTIQSGEALKRT